MKDSSYRADILTVFIAINTVVFLLLSALHFYWALGGTLWYADVLPTNSKGFKRMNPGIIATLVVAFGLLLFTFITIGNLGTWGKRIKTKYFRYGVLLIAILFF